jgi:hypothetical protein
MFRLTLSCAQALLEPGLGYSHSAQVKAATARRQETKTEQARMRLESDFRGIQHSDVDVRMLNTTKVRL